MSSQPTGNLIYNDAGPKYGDTVSRASGGKASGFFDGLYVDRPSTGLTLLAGVVMLAAGHPYKALPSVKTSHMHVTVES
jgi:hypothetical protein